MKRFSLILFSTLIFYCNLQTSPAQLCVAQDVKVSTGSGIAVFINGTVLKDILITLSRDFRGEKIVKEVRTDESGQFSFGEVKSGQYYVLVRNIEYLSDLVVKVKIKKKYGRKNPTGIKIVMGVNLGGCSHAEPQILKEG